MQCASWPPYFKKWPKLFFRYLNFSWRKSPSCRDHWSEKEKTNYYDWDDVFPFRWKKKTFFLIFSHSCRLESNVLSVNNLISSNKINSCFKQNLTMQTYTKNPLGQQKTINVNSRMHWRLWKRRFLFLLIFSLLKNISLILVTVLAHTKIKWQELI